MSSRPGGPSYQWSYGNQQPQGPPPSYPQQQQQQWGQQSQNPQYQGYYHSQGNYPGFQWNVDKQGSHGPNGGGWSNQFTGQVGNTQWSYGGSHSWGHPQSQGGNHSHQGQGSWQSGKKGFHVHFFIHFHYHYSYYIGGQNQGITFICT